MRTLICMVVGVVACVGGCPQPQALQNTGAVQAVIGISQRSGEAPLSIIVSGTKSESKNGGPYTYRWDFGDGTKATDVTASHTYQNPGRYLLRLEVIDGIGEAGVTGTEIRVAGEGAVAVIGADPASGAAPLTVEFDATQSIVEDDTIYDYAWDFGDGTQAQTAQPSHTYVAAGDYLVTLTITTAGGLEATTYTTISVSGSSTGGGDGDGASLQFDGSHLATLPTRAEPTLTECTIEAWFEADTGGGTIVATADGSLSAQLVPSGDSLRLNTSLASADGDADRLTRSWRHIAIVFSGSESDTDGDDAADGDATPVDGDDATPVDGGDEDEAAAGVCTLYLDGVLIASADAGASITLSGLRIGVGFAGRIGEVRVWSTARTTAQIGAARDQRIDGLQAGLIGAWPLDDGSGQSLRNAAGGNAGLRGSSAAEESTDPDWVTEGPPL